MAKLLTFDEYNEKVKNLKTLSDVTNFAKDLIAPTLQEMLEAEMSNHLGYPKNDPSGNLTGNSRNGHYNKTLKTNFGEAKMNVPRDRNGSFEPLVVKKGESVQSDVEEKIISMYAKGMTTRDINEHMQEIYGVSISSDMVSSITDKVQPLIEEWQSRPLDALYPVVYCDGVHFKVRDNGKIVSKCAYILLGVSAEGSKEVLGIWIGESEGAKFWMQVLSEIKHRGVEDILICCVDGLSGFSDAIKTVYPDAVIQRCIVHQIRNTTKYIPHKHKKAFCIELKKIYSAPSEEAGLQALLSMQEQWPQYKVYLQKWEERWDELSPFFSYPAALRRMIYTTNAIESLNRQFRKVTKTTSIFPHDKALAKLLWLAQRDIAKKWNMPVRNWGQILAQLSILFPDKITLS
jgi:putative transposase